jgi:hypothetical protein
MGGPPEGDLEGSHGAGRRQGESGVGIVLAAALAARDRVRRVPAPKPSAAALRVTAAQVRALWFERQGLDVGRPRAGGSADVVRDTG